MPFWCSISKSQVQIKLRLSLKSTFHGRNEIRSLYEMKLDNYWWVYTMECVPSGRTYVGLTGKPNPAWRWAEHFIQLRNGISKSPKLQEEWNRYPDLCHWKFGTVGRVDGKVAGNDLEARTIRSIPEDKRLSEKQKTAISQDKRERCEQLLTEGKKYVDIAKELDVSLGWISNVRHTFRRSRSP